MTAGLLSLPVWIELGARESRRWVDAEIAARLAQRPWWTWVSVVVLAAWMGIALGPASDEVLLLYAVTGVLIALLVALARCDLMCRLLPDVLTLSLIGLGLLTSLGLDSMHPLHSLIGALIGYGLLWSLGAVFRRLRGVEAIGRGDFSMAAGVGAWLGWQGLPLALMVASLGALLVTLVLRATRRTATGSEIPSTSRGSFLRQEMAFGPALGVGLLIGWSLLG